MVEIQGSEVLIDYSGAPDATAGPVNCPLPSTVSASIVAITMLAGGGDAPNEGHFRPVKIVTRPGSLFHPVAPQPCYLYGWSAFQAMDAILQALAEPLKGRAPSGCAWDICATHVYATSPVTGDLEKFSTPMSVGQGAHAGGDGGTVFVPALSNSRFVSVELEEARFPVRYEKAEFIADSGGAGQYQGGLGWERRFRVLRDAHVTSLLERTKEPSWGQAGGLPGLTNRFTVRYPDGTETDYVKKTRFPIPAGTELSVRAGGGGGYGPPSQRAAEAVIADLENEFITRTFAERHYAHAITPRGKP